eukprot:CAMPEP_0170544492 /NCGR_PEP_ID=MMETSP0211-20121228/3230_1 /TAXON_ID=311385 /ORGANISM="Pseudokeronopsis sp., Strain OXSARD2" /LENGTH=91 /DNA_ID=CAMNT_0010848149 /DNA_START=212 /DNA_END=487 /DNA_ORIENTATION=-
MFIDDIPGARAKPLYKSLAKDILSHKDIDGTSPKYEKIKPKPYNLLDYSDVYEKKSLHHSIRDPQNPTYQYRSPKGTLHRYGDIEGNHPKM